MNCRDIARILDDGVIGELADADLRRVGAHVAICAECAADWAIQSRVNEIAVPEMPQALLRWRPDAARAPRANAFGGRRGRGPIVAALLIAGAAAAMFAVYDALESTRAVDATADRAASGAPAELPATSAAVQPEAADGTGSAEPAREADVDADARNGAASRQRHRLVILPPLHEVESVEARQAVEEAHRAIVQFFLDRPDVEVIAPTPVQLAEAEFRLGVETKTDIDLSAVLVAELSKPEPRVDVEAESAARAEGTESTRDDHDSIVAVTRLLGSEYSVRVGSRPQPASTGWMIRIEVHTGRSHSSSSQGGRLSESSARQAAVRAYVDLFPDAGVKYRESIVGDFGYPDSERIQALANLTRQLSPSTLQAAVELGRFSTSAETRLRVWELLAETDNPLVARALMDALLADSDASVRAAVADLLMDYRLDPVVQAALVAAAASDVSADVRLRARWSTLTREERSEYVSAALLDSALTFEERMAPLAHARTHRRGMSNAEFKAAEIPAVPGEALDAVAVIAASSRDAATRTTALVELALGGHPEFLRHFMAERERRVRQNVSVDLANRRDTPGLVEHIRRQLDELGADEETRGWLGLLVNPRN